MRWGTGRPGACIRAGFVGGRSLLTILILLLFAACTSSPASETLAPTQAAAPGRIPPATQTGLTRPLFDGTHAYQEYLLGQMKIGLRSTGSAGARATGDYILAQLNASHVPSAVQEFTYRGVPIRNVIGKLAAGSGPLILVGAHYDTRVRANMDKVHPDQPVPGADDGASGVAVLLELARRLDVSKLHHEVWLAFFDAEDNGDLTACDLLQAADPNRTAACDTTPWPWSVGSTYVAEHLTLDPTAVVILDMIGDANQDIYYEQNSDKALQEQIWSMAARLGYSEQFIPQYKWSMTDDHTPFLQRGIHAVDIIDFDYPYWHTTQDTADKVSPTSLERVGRVMQVWLESQ